MEISKVRLLRARQLAEQVGGPAEFGRRISRSDSQVSQIIGENPSRNIGARMARHIEKVFGLPKGWLDKPPQTFSEIVQAAAEELEKRDRETQVHFLEMIKRIPPATSDDPPWPADDELPLAASFPAEAPKTQPIKRRKK